MDDDTVAVRESTSRFPNTLSALTQVLHRAAKVAGSGRIRYIADLDKQHHPFSFPVLGSRYLIQTTASMITGLPFKPPSQCTAGTRIVGSQLSQARCRPKHRLLSMLLHDAYLPSAEVEGATPLTSPIPLTLPPALRCRRLIRLTL